jgi:hypothetical protein
MTPRILPILVKKSLYVSGSKPNDPMLLTKNYGWYSRLSASSVISNPPLRHADLLGNVFGGQQSFDSNNLLFVVEHKKPSLTS